MVLFRAGISALALGLTLAFALPAAAQSEGAGGLAGPRPGSSSTLPPTTDGGPASTGDAASTPSDETPSDDQTGRVPSGTTGASTGSEAAPMIPPPPPTDDYRAPVTEGEARIPANLATRIRVLDQSLANLAARSGNGMIDGVLSLLSGGLSIGLGIWLTTESTDQAFANYLFLLGSASVARGVLDLALRPKASPFAIEFGHMPMRNAAEVQARLEYGEDALQGLARRARISRLLDASISLASGIAVIPFFVTADGFPPDDPIDYFLVIWSGVSVISGIINLATRSSAERRWSAYEELRDRLDDEGQSAAIDEAFGGDEGGLRFETAGAAILPGGGAALSVGFSL